MDTQAHLRFCCLHANRGIFYPRLKPQIVVSFVQEKCKHDLISLNLYLVKRTSSGDYKIWYGNCKLNFQNESLGYRDRSKSQEVQNITYINLFHITFAVINSKWFKGEYLKRLSLQL